jgi:hypothetical protein
MYFSWLPVEAALPVFNIGFLLLLLNWFFLKNELMKTTEIAVSAKS